MAQSKTKPSTRRLSEVARHVVVPTGIVSTGWPAVEAKCREFGDSFDEWQVDLGRLILAKRADGNYAATVGGVTLSIPRQVAKTFLIGRIIFALCILFPGTTVLWTAHRTRTATQTFRNLSGFAKRRKVAPYVAEVRRTNGEQEIAFTNGSVIMFGAREQGFGRGFDKVDIEVFDEAQILTDKALDDMVPATNQSQHPHGALLFYMGTPPRPTDPGDVFTHRRTEALAVREQGLGRGFADEKSAEWDAGEWDALYVECSADRKKALANPNDREQWAVANPSYPHRTPLQSMLRMRKNLTSDESWCREALGIWDELVAATESAVPNWANLAYIDGERQGITANMAWALAVSPVEHGVQWASIGKAGRTADGFLHVEWVEHRKGTRWIVPACVEHYAANGRVPLRVHVGGPEGSFVKSLREAGVMVEEVSGTDVAHATGALLDAASEGGDGSAPQLRHLGQPSLDKSVESAHLRTGTDGAAKWDQRKSSVEITPLQAVTVALGGVPETPKKQAPMFAVT